MERMPLSRFAAISATAMFQLRKNIELTGEDQHWQTYMLQMRFPPNCNPRNIDLHMYRSSDGKFGMRVDPHFRYDGANYNLRRLADQGDLIFGNWPLFECALRSLTEEPPPSREMPPTTDVTQSPNASVSPSTPATDELTNWDEIRVEEPEKIRAPSFEDIRDKLSQVVIGQDECIETIAYTVAQHLLKRSPTKPVSILAAGPPGVGKSETAKSLAKILTEATGREYSAVWIDLNNFTEKHTVYRLIGAPAGYVGYEDECVFETVAKNPYTVMICDELDKAHPEVIKTFMAVLEKDAVLPLSLF